MVSKTFSISNNLEKGQVVKVVTVKATKKKFKDYSRYTHYEVEKHLQIKSKFKTVSFKTNKTKLYKTLLYLLKRAI